MVDYSDIIAQLQSGGLVIMPTETVYGLAGSATNESAIESIYRIKNRPHFNPLIIHCAHFDWVYEFAQPNEYAQQLAKILLPAPISLILPLKTNHQLAKNALAGLDSVCVRVPNHPIALALLTQFQRPLAAPSANPSGALSPTRFAHVKQFADTHHIPIIDGGDSVIGLESTIIDARTYPFRIARLGVITAEYIRTHTQLLVIDKEMDNQASVSPTIISPGQLLRHYAPQKPLRIHCENPQADEFFIGYGNMQCDYNLSPTQNEGEMARNLFHALWLGDASNKPKIAVAPITNTPIGMAINDKLIKAKWLTE